MKTIIIYFSYTGNTKKIVDKIQEQIKADTLEIKTIDQYAGDYQTVVDQGLEEVNKGFKPAIQNITIDISNYDTIILGTPVWWYTVAPAILTFLTQYDLAGKTIIPFATNGGWIGHTFKDIKKICSNANVQQEMNIEFEGNTLKTPQKEIEKWIERIGE